MNKRQEAPGRLELVREFVNTRDVEAGTEELETPAALSEWLAAHALADRAPLASTATTATATTATPDELTRALALREALRELMLANNVSAPAPAPAARILDDAAARARVQLRFDGACAGTLEPAAAGVDGAFGRLLAIVYESIAAGTWSRLKACREHTCEWAFYDHTKNRSGTWCDMAVCGNRAKARNYRERRAPSANG
jgi:predicted RNA-binding Zn ribbon-like protein